MEPEIRAAITGDLRGIQELNLLLFKKEHEEFDTTLDCEWTFSEKGERYFAARISEGSVFVACIDDKVIGYVAGGIIEYKVPYRILPVLAELENMFILEKHRGKGLGSKLNAAFLGWCKTRGVGKLRVVASAQNVKGINFYRKNGFLDYDLSLEMDI